MEKNLTSLSGVNSIKGMAMRQRTAGIWNGR